MNNNSYYNYNDLYIFYNIYQIFFDTILFLLYFLYFLLLSKMTTSADQVLYISPFYI